MHYPSDAHVLRREVKRITRKAPVVLTTRIAAYTASTYISDARDAMLAGTITREEFIDDVRNWLAWTREGWRDVPESLSVREEITRLAHDIMQEDE